MSLLGPTRSTRSHPQIRSARFLPSARAWSTSCSASCSASDRLITIGPLLARLIRRCCHRHIMVCHGCLSFRPSESLSVSGQTSYTADLTVPSIARVAEAMGVSMDQPLRRISRSGPSPSSQSPTARQKQSDCGGKEYQAISDEVAGDLCAQNCVQDER